MTIDPISQNVELYLECTTECAVILPPAFNDILTRACFFFFFCIRKFGEAAPQTATSGFQLLHRGAVALIKRDTMTAGLLFSSASVLIRCLRCFHGSNRRLRWRQLTLQTASQDKWQEPAWGRWVATRKQLGDGGGACTVTFRHDSLSQRCCNMNTIQHMFAGCELFILLADWQQIRTW